MLRFEETAEFIPTNISEDEKPVMLESIQCCLCTFLFKLIYNLSNMCVVVQIKSLKSAELIASATIRRYWVYLALGVERARNGRDFVEY